MVKAGCLLVLLCLSLWTAAKAQSGDNRGRIGPKDTLAPLQKWLAELISAGEEDTAHVFKSLNQASARAKAANKVLEEAIIQRAGGIYYRKLKQYHRSFGWYYRSYDLFELAGDPYEIVSAGLDLSKAQYFRGNYRQSMQHYSYAVELAATHKITDKEIEALEILGLLYNAFQNFTAGATVFRKSLDLKYQLNDEQGVLYTLEILSTIYYRHHQYDSSLMYATRALELAQKHRKQSEIELCRLNRGAALVRLKRMPEALQEIGELSTLDVRGSNVNLCVRYNVLAGNYYLAINSDKLATAHYNAALNKADLNLFPELYALIFNNMADSYYERGDLKNAYQYSRKYTEWWPTCIPAKT